MTAGLEQLDRLLDLPLDQICAGTIERHESEIVGFNTAQLDKGLDATGKSLGQYQNYNYKNWRKNTGKIFLERLKRAKNRLANGCLMM